MPTHFHTWVPLFNIITTFGGLEQAVLSILNDLPEVSIRSLVALLTSQASSLYIPRYFLLYSNQKLPTRHYSACGKIPRQKVLTIMKVKDLNK
jgi:hypothetical protein